MKPTKPPEWWKVALFGAAAPGADPEWRSQRIRLSLALVLGAVVLYLVVHGLAAIF
jgi:hypothetical protein